MLGRGHDVGEEDGHGQHIGLGPAAGTGQELLDLINQGVGVAHKEQVVVARKDDKSSAGDVLGQVLASTQVDVTVSLPMHDQGGNRDGGEKRANIGFVNGPDDFSDQIGATAEPCRPCQPGSESLVGDPTRGE